MMLTRDLFREFLRTWPWVLLGLLLLSEGLTRIHLMQGVLS